MTNCWLCTNECLCEETKDFFQPTLFCNACGRQLQPDNSCPLCAEERCDLCNAHVHTSVTEEGICHRCNCCGHEQFARETCEDCDTLYRPIRLDDGYIVHACGLCGYEPGL